MSNGSDPSTSSDSSTPKSVFEWTPPSSPSATSILRLPGFTSTAIKPSSPSQVSKHLRFKLRPVSRDRPLLSGSSSNGLGLVLGGEHQASDYGSKAVSASRTLNARDTNHALSAGRLDGLYLPASPQAVAKGLEPLRLPPSEGRTQPLRLRRPEARRVGTSPAVLMVRSGSTVRSRMPMSSSDSYLAAGRESGPLGAFERELLGMFGPQAPVSPPPRHAARPPCTVIARPKRPDLFLQCGEPQLHKPPVRPERPQYALMAGREDKPVRGLEVPFGPLVRPALPARSPLRPIHTATIGPSSGTRGCADSSPPPMPGRAPPPPPFDRSTAIKIPTYFDLSHEYLQDGPPMVDHASRVVPTRRRSISLSTMRSQGSRYSILSHISDERVETPATAGQDSVNDTTTLAQSPSSSSDRSSVPSLSRSPTHTNSWLPSSPESITSSSMVVVDSQRKESNRSQDWSQYKMTPRVTSPILTHSRDNSADSVYFTPGPSPKTVSICLEPSTVIKSRRPSSSGQVEDLLSANAAKVASHLAARQRLRSHSQLESTKKTQDLLEALRLDAASRLEVGSNPLDRKVSATEWRFGGVGTAF